MNYVTKSYRRYCPEIKKMIASSRNPDLFPELNIPRSTALYWIKTAVDNGDEKNIDLNGLCKNEIKRLRKELQKEKSLRTMMESFIKIFPVHFHENRVKNYKQRKKTINFLRKATQNNKLSVCLKCIGLSKSTYQRWSVEFKNCEHTGSKECGKKRATQLTGSEVNIMRDFITAKKYAHFSVGSLHYHAMRLGKLFCCKDTWYKYKNLFNWTRPRPSKAKKIYHEGLRARYTNEFWHIDASVVVFPDGSRAYIQAIIDNFSRYVIDWKTTTRISAKQTMKLLKKAKHKIQSHVSLMMDRGTENINKEVTTLFSNNFKRLIARVDIHYSNSMIEALFRTLKNNFLNHKIINTFEELQRKVNYFFNQYNKVIPHYSLNGATPQEVFTSSWNQQKADHLKQLKKDAMRKRMQENMKIMRCSVCA